MDLDASQNPTSGSPLIGHPLSYCLIEMQQTAFTACYVQIDEHTNPGKYRHEHDDHELLYCLEGAGQQLTPYGEVPIQRGDLFVFARGQQHMSYCAHGEQFSCMVFNLSEVMYDENNPHDKEALRALRNIGMYANEQSCHFPLQQACSKRIAHLLNQVNVEFLRRSPGYNAVIKAHITEILIAILRDPLLTNHKLPALPIPSNSEIIGEILHYIEINYMYPISIQDILQFCPLSRSHFHAVFKNECGMTFVEALHAVRIRRACELLKSSPEQGVLDIALSCGFQSQSHFCHTFKKTMSVSPTQFRKVHA